MNIIKKKFKVKYLVVLFFVGGIFSICSTANAANQTGTIIYDNEDWATPPVDPLNPETVVNPGEVVSTSGLLRLDFIPKLNFGINLSVNDDVTYYAYAQLFHDDTSERANFVQVTDHRDKKTGWTLSVKQESQFKNERNEELNGAFLSFDNQWVNSSSDMSLAPTIQKDAIVINEMNTDYPIASAANERGGNTWVISFGASSNDVDEENTLVPLLNSDGSSLTSSEFNNKPIFLNKAISLTVPGKTKKTTGTYTTVLTWTISELS